MHCVNLTDVVSASLHYQKQTNNWNLIISRFAAQYRLQPILINKLLHQTMNNKHRRTANLHTAKFGSLPALTISLQLLCEWMRPRSTLIRKKQAAFGHVCFCNHILICGGGFRSVTDLSHVHGALWSSGAWVHVSTISSDNWQKKNHNLFRLQKQTKLLTSYYVII